MISPGGGRGARRLLLIAATTAVSALVLAGCSSAAPAGTPSASKTAATTTGLSEKSLANIAAYTGSKLGAADTSLSPITWGYINQEGGALTFPQYTTFVNSLVETVNTKLGGIGGHPLQIVACHVVSSDEDGQACGQKFASNKAITAILQFPLINGNASFHRVIDSTGIPIIGDTANGAQDAAAPTGYYMSGPDVSTVPIMSSYVIKTLKPKTVSIIGIQGQAISQEIAGLMKTTFQKAGIQATLASVPQTSTDATAPLVAANVQKSDAIVALLNGPSLCAAVAKSLKTLGVTKTPVITVPGCSDDAVKQILGDFPQWTYIEGYPVLTAPALDTRETDERAVAEDLWKAIGSTDGSLIYSAPTLQTFLTALALVNTAGADKATAKTTIAATASFKGPLFLGPSTVGWGTIPKSPHVATIAQRLYTYGGDGKWVDAADGWFTPAP